MPNRGDHVYLGVVLGNGCNFAAPHDGERTGGKSPESWCVTVEFGSSPSIQLVISAEPAPGECRHKYKKCIETTLNYLPTLTPVFALQPSG